MSINLVNTASDSVISMFQLQKSIRIRADQNALISSMAALDHNGRFPEIVKRMIMGGGKTEIVMPILAYKKAKKNNLVIFEAPATARHLYHAGLRRTSKTLLGQDPLFWDLDIHHCSSSQLERLYYLLLQAEQQGNYVITTNSLLQPLELKYLELFYTNAKNRSSILILEKLLHLMLEHGDLLLDEVHQGLLYKEKLHYGLGEKIAPETNTIHEAVSFYRFLHQLKYPFPQGNTCTFHDLLSGAIKVEQEQVFIEYILEQLITATSSPLYDLIHEINDVPIEAIKNFLKDKDPKQAYFLQHISNEYKEILSFYKAELSTFLCATLGRKHRVNYGESLDKTMIADQRAVALPYSANNKPKYGNDFGMLTEEINFTIQALLLSGLTPELTQILLLNWQKTAHDDAIMQQCPIDETVKGALFKTISGESIEAYSFKQLGENHPIYQRVYQQSDVIFEALEQFVLPKIRLQRHILSSDALAHVATVRTCQGLSGTLSNASTYHHRIRYKDQHSGSDGYIISAILDKKTPCMGIDFTNTQDFIKQLLDKAPANTRAFIDISATFRGIDNLVIAQTIAAYLLQHPQRIFSRKGRIKYILYFNETDQLYALPVTNPIKSAVPILLHGSDAQVITKKLKVSADERITLYDHAHTLATNVVQDFNAHAYVFVDDSKDLYLESFCQAVMRMRGLIEQGQSLTIVMPTLMHQQLSQNDNAEQMMPMLINRFYSNEITQIRVDNFHSTLGKIRILFRTDLRNRLLAVPAENMIIKPIYFRFFLHFLSKPGSLVFTKNLVKSVLNNKHRSYLKTLVSSI